MREPGLTRQPNVFRDRQVEKYIADLKGARESFQGDQMGRQTGDVLPLEEDSSPGGRKLPCDEVEESRFTGPVLADDRSELPRFKRRIKIRDSREPSEILMKVPYLQETGAS